MLLTGTTGYLGMHLLKQLIDSGDTKIYCMVRAKGVLTPEARLKSLLMYYFSDSYETLFQTRIIPVDGDITDPQTLAALKGCGTQSPEEAGSSVFDESKLFMQQSIENPYVISKFLSERVVLQAVAEGMDGKVMRVGNLKGRHADGEFQINFRSNAFINMLKSYKVLGMFPLSGLIAPTEVSPIDCVAQAIYQLSLTPPEVVMLHAYNNNRLNMAMLIYAMKEYGFNMELVSDERFHAHFKATMQDPAKSEYLGGLLHYGTGETKVPVRDDNSYTSLLLYRNDIRWPVADEGYAQRLVGMLDGMGFFDE